MPRMRTVGPALAILFLWGAAIPLQPAARAPNPSMEALTWLVGCLEMRTGDRVVEEQRMGLRGASMLGMARTTTSTGLIEYELTLIHEKAGKILFEARPSGQRAAIFAATHIGADSAVFAAP